MYHQAQAGWSYSHCLVSLSMPALWVQVMGNPIFVFV